MAVGKFTANPGELRRASQMMEQLPAQAAKIGDNFISDIQNYRGWAGYSDDFAHEVLPKYDANNQSCLDLVRALSSAFTELGQAVWANGQHIEGVSNYARDEIDRQMSSLDTPGDSSQGGRH
ncbi:MULTISPECIES: hypothetical protein [unclassified Streptomyces]|uniref:hypothetical protein n=1 Tax=unclassified Streptomyces TaxID=2593676 RepID=UPI000CD4D75C|nr:MULTISPECIES: hypothetical protein [unclassified Streptomyces]MCI4042361.1 hypothetical protein [Streptomyces sp. TRM75563]